MISYKNFFCAIAAIICTIMALYLPSLVLLDSYKSYEFKKQQEVKVEQILEDRVDKEKNCLKNALYYEARSEDRLGILAVASVIENRKNSTIYPSTYCGVVNQYKQFSYTIEEYPDVELIMNDLTIYDKISYAYISKLADTMTDGEFLSVLPSTVMWYTTETTSNKWTRSKKIYATIGVHHFYKQKEKTNASK